MAGELRAFVTMLAGSRPSGRLLEVRYRNPNGPGMHQVFIPATRAEDAEAAVSRVAARCDTYTGVLLRDRRAGGKDAVSHSHLLFVEIDAADAYRRLLRAPEAPSAVISSGTPGHLHAYWQLEEDVDANDLEAGNRKLANAIGGDQVSVDAARILRPPNTWNFKHAPPVKTRLELLDERRRYSYRDLTGELHDPAPRKPTPRADTQRPRLMGISGPGTIDAQLRAIATEDYVMALTGQEPNGERKVACPFPHHGNGEEWIPSLQLRNGGEWNCFGCGTGGTIYDFAAHLFGMSTKGREFIRLRNRLAAVFGISEPADSTRSPQGQQLTPAIAGTEGTRAVTAAGLER